MNFTAKEPMKLAMVGGAIAATALLSACGGNTGAGAGSPVKAASAAAFEQVPQGGGPGAAPGGSAGSAASQGDVDCSRHGGQVGPAGGPQMDLIAKVSTDGSIPGCTEAFTVIAAYYQKVPTEGEGPGRRVLNAEGDWDCALLDPAARPGVVRCGKGATGLAIETAPSAGTAPAPAPRKFPNTTQQVQFTGYDSAEDMIRFQLVAHHDGGPDDGTWDPVDDTTYRLPIQSGAEVLSAATMCPGESATIGDDGLGTGPCSRDELLEKLKDVHPILAQIVVNGDDRITSIKEIYHP
ncbi:hypothetical protein [Amycolatopsis sp. PS_44_ISF1]|uniref:hypothetical protein n=1 Tax=Amycolatopsis sp. PS_44_ISF1 TaxID=2974917 RepID=UPI0028DD9AE7|nr:hypothetical protein [Amycolatopsis sp. PS_44_ISF1]MDT8913034.1 hypothetical protein [Amycolatopsis sp. PS_44_ISF1]